MGRYTYGAIGDQVGPAVVSKGCVGGGQEYGDKAGGGLHVGLSMLDKI